MEHIPSSAANWVSASQEIPLILWNRSFITAFTSARNLSPFWARSIQSMTPHSTSWWSILILSSHLRLGLLSVQEWRPLNSSLYSVLHFPVTSSFIGPNILLNTLFSNTLSYCNFYTSQLPYYSLAKWTCKFVTLYSRLLFSISSRYHSWSWCALTLLQGFQWRLQSSRIWNKIEWKFLSKFREVLLPPSSE